MSVALGISLGTESCVLAVSTTAGRFDVVADDMGERATPFYVSFSNEEVLVGLSAKNAAVRKPKNTVHGILALLSANEDSDVNALKLTCDVDTDADGSGVVLTSVADCGDEATDISRTPNDVILEYFGRLSVLLTNAAGNSSIGSVVVAVPRGTNTGKVIDAVHRSGMVPHSATVRVVFDDECAAATIRPDAFAADTVATAAATEHALIVDWGANTLSVSLLALHAASVEPVRAATSLGKVGGRQLDKALCNTIADAFQRKTRADPREEPRSMRKLALSVEKTKMALSVSQNASVELEAFCNGADLNEPLSRMKLEMAFDTLGATAVLDQLLSQVVDGASVQYVVLAGGMCRVPRVQALIRNAVAKFCASAQIVDKGAPDEVAALGACIAAQSLPHSRSSWLDGDVQATVLPYALVAATADGSHFALVDAQEPLPTTRTVKFATPPAGQPQPLVLGALADGAVSWMAKADVPPNCPGVDIVVDADGTITVRALDAFSKRKGAVLVTLSPAN